MTNQTPTLPPLPEPAITSSQTDSILRVMTVHSFSHDQMNAHYLAGYEAGRAAQAPEAVSLDKMMDAFITSEMRGGDKYYALIFKYPSYEALFAAEDQLNAFTSAIRTTPKPAAQAGEGLAPTEAAREPINLPYLGKPSFTLPNGWQEGIDAFTRVETRAYAREAVLADRAARMLTQGDDQVLTDTNAFADSLCEMIGRISTGLGISEEDQSCANGDAEILDAIGRLAATPGEPAETVIETGPRAAPTDASFLWELDRLAKAAEANRPAYGLCPSGCGCVWRDNFDGSLSLGMNQRSCTDCEPLPFSKLVPLFVRNPEETWANVCERLAREGSQATPPAPQGAAS